MSKNLNKVVRVKDGMGNMKGLALVTSFCGQPQYDLVKTNGERYHWCCNLCEAANSEETIEYWQNRASLAEQEVEKLKEKLDAGKEE